MQFIITKCDTCSHVDGSILVTKSYDHTRDLKEWTKEGRAFTIIDTVNKPFPKWCTCPPNDE